MEGMYLETLKGGYDEPIANITNEGKMKALSERSRTRQGQEQDKNETFFSGVHFKVALGN